MRKFALAFAWAGAALIPLLNAAPAAAQLDHTYVTQTGSGSVCSFAAPCGSVQTAIGQTNANGDVYILNGDYTENIVINKAIAISGEDPVGVIIRATTTNNTSTTVTINAPNNANVNLFNLSIFPDANGIQFNTGRQLNVHGGTSATGAGNIGIIFAPTTPASGGGVTRLFMSSVSASGSNGAILIKPSGGVAVDAILDNVRTNNSLFGVRVDNTGGSGNMKINIDGSRAFHSTNNGYLVVGSGANPVQVVIDHSTADASGAFGAVATGANASLLVTSSTLTNNTTGLGQLTGASVNTYQDNAISFNGTDTSGTITNLTKK